MSGFLHRFPPQNIFPQRIPEMPFLQGIHQMPDPDHKPIPAVFPFMKQPVCQKFHTDDELQEEKPETFQK